VSSTTEETVPLSRNRNYQLLWGSQALADFGVNASTIAFPLLTLSLTGSASASGLVLATVAAARLIAGLPAGALADRWSRKKIIVMCAAVQAVTAGTLVAALWAGRATVAHLVVMAALMGVCAALFDPAEDASLPNLVPAEQLPSAVALKSARTYLGQLTGSAAGGLLFAVGRAVPFAAHALTHAVAFAGLLFLRMPPRVVQPQPARHIGREIGHGLRWVWSNRYIRVTMLCAIVLNLFFSAFYVVVIVLAALRGVPSGQIGLMAAMLGAGGVVGALLAARLSQLLSPYLSLVLVFWVVTVLTPVAAVFHNGYLLGLLFFAMALLPPTANTVIISRQLLLTPDEMRGRLSGVLGLVAGLAATIGPIVGGALVEALSGGSAVLVCTAGIAVTAVLVTASPTLRGRRVDPPTGTAAENQPHEPAAPH
jgi:MFS family permease